MSVGMREKLGISIRFPYSDYERVDSACRDLNLLNVRNVRISIPWAEVVRSRGWEWAEYVITKFSESGYFIMVCIWQTPPLLSQTGRVNGPPDELDEYAGFLSDFCDSFRGKVHAIEHWTKPNDPQYWDLERDPDWSGFARMVRTGARVVNESGMMSILGGARNISPENWVRQMANLGVLEVMDAVSFHAYPGMGSLVNGSAWYPPEPWVSWEHSIRAIAEVSQGLPVICTETGFATWDVRNRKPGLYLKQIKSLEELEEAPLDLVYWHSLYDERMRTSRDPLACHLGLICSDCSRKSAYYRLKAFMR